MADLEIFCLQIVSCPSSLVQNKDFLTDKMLNYLNGIFQLMTWTNA